MPSEETISHETIQLKVIPPRGQVHASLGTRELILNTERFHKRDPQKRGQYSTPGSKGLEHDRPVGLGCRMKCPNNGVGTQEVSMNLSVTWAHRTLDDLSAVRMNETVEPLLAQQTGIVTGLDETQRTVQTLVPKSAYRSVRGTLYP